MKQCMFCIIMIFIFLLWACAPKAPVPMTLESEDELFSKAEKLFLENSFDEAIAVYQEFVSRFRDRPMAAAALLKIATIYTSLGKTFQARQTYDRLISEYPASPLLPEALVQRTSLMFEQEDYASVLEEGLKALEKVSSASHIAQLYALMGDAHVARKDPVAAADAFMKARQHAEDPWKPVYASKLKKAIEMMDPSDIIFLIQKSPESELSGYLLYQLALISMKEEKYHEAEKTLAEMIDRFPNHDASEAAEALLTELYKNYMYRHDTIGCLLPLSGPYKSYGDRALKGIELALNLFCARNPGFRGAAVIRDTAAESNRTAAAARELIEARVAALIGPLIMPEPAAIEAQRSGVPIILLTQKDRVTDIGNFVFRNFITPRMQVKTLVSYASGKLGLKRFAILYPDQKYGSTLMNLFWDEVIAWGGTVVGAESYDVNQTDFADAIQKLVGLYYEIPKDLRETEPLIDEAENSIIEKKADSLDAPEPEQKAPRAIVDFDAIFIPDSPKSAGLIIPQLAFYDIHDVHLIGTNVWHSDQLIQMAQPYVEGAVLTDSFYADSTSEVVRNFVRKFQEVYGERPGYIEAVAYDTATMLFHAISQTHVQTREGIRNALLSSNSYDGATGFSIFGENGEIRKNLYLLKIQGNRFIEIDKGTPDSWQIRPKRPD